MQWGLGEGGKKAFKLELNILSGLSASEVPALPTSSYPLWCAWRRLEVKRLSRGCSEPSTPPSAACHNRWPRDAQLPFPFPRPHLQLSPPWLSCCCSSLGRRWCAFGCQSSKGSNMPSDFQASFMPRSLTTNLSLIISSWHLCRGGEGDCCWLSLSIMAHNKRDSS